MNANTGRGRLLPTAEIVVLEDLYQEDNYKNTPHETLYEWGVRGVLERVLASQAGTCAVRVSSGQNVKSSEEADTTSLITFTDAGRIEVGDQQCFIEKDSYKPVMAKNICKGQIFLGLSHSGVPQTNAVLVGLCVAKNREVRSTKTTLYTFTADALDNASCAGNAFVVTLKKDGALLAVNVLVDI